MSIIKRKKTSHYAQIHNSVLQGGLKNLGALGLLSHIMSLPETWELHKSQLHNTFTRRTVDSAWKEMSERGYAIGFRCHKDGKVNYYYSVSDLPFTTEEFEYFVITQIKELQLEGASVQVVEPMVHSTFDITDKISDVLNVQQTVSCDAPFVQHKTSCTKGAYIKKHEPKEILINKYLSSSSHAPVESIDYGFIDQALRDKFPDAPLDHIKYDMMNDPTLTLETERQYGAMLSYRLNNYTAPVEKKKSTPKKSKKTYIVPEWFEKNGKSKARKEKELSAAEIDAQRTALLIELGVI